MENYSFDNNLKNERKNVIKLVDVNGFIAYQETPDVFVAAYIKDNEGNLIRFDDSGFVLFDSVYDEYLSVNEYCVLAGLELIEILMDNSDYHVSCLIE